MKYAPNILDSALWREIVLANQSFERKGLKINKELEGEHIAFKFPRITGTRLGKRTNKKFNSNAERQLPLSCVLHK